MIKYGTIMRANQIIKCEVDDIQETFIHEGRIYWAKDSKYAKFFNTWTEAHAFLKAEAQAAYDLAKAKYKAAATELNKVVEMVDPELHDEDANMCDTDNRVCNLCGGCLK